MYKKNTFTLLVLSVLLLSLENLDAYGETSHLLLLRTGVSRSVVPSGRVSTPGLNGWGSAIGASYGLEILRAGIFTTYLIPIDITVHAGIPTMPDNWALLGSIGVRAELMVSGSFFAYVRGSGGGGATAEIPVGTVVGGIGVGYRPIKNLGLLVEPFSCAWQGSTRSPDVLLFQTSVGLALFLNPK